MYRPADGARLADARMQAAGEPYMLQCSVTDALHASAAATGREICSSLMLQQLLYYNLFWSAAWIIAVGVRVHIKVRKQAALKHNVICGEGRYSWLMLAQAAAAVGLCWSSACAARTSSAASITSNQLLLLHPCCSLLFDHSMGGGAAVVSCCSMARASPWLIQT
jgi:hypothetical protein